MSRSGADGRPVRVTVFIPTYLRPVNLAVMLPMLLAQSADIMAADPADFRGIRFAVDILVVDNDPEGSARAVAESLGVRYVIEPEQGVSAVRNRAFDETTGSSLLCSMDDDERPVDGWLAGLLRTWADTRPAVVAGRVVAENEDELEPFVLAGKFFVRRNLPTGTPIKVAAAGNVLFDLEQVRRWGIRFDPRLSLTGGEDTMFSRQLVAAGGRMVWCAEAVAVETIPGMRATRNWVLTRQLRNGNSATLIDLLLAPSSSARLAVRVKRVLAGTTRIVLGTLFYLLGVALRSERREARGSRAVYRGRGMVAGAFGFVYQEYAQSREPWRRSGAMA
jgi:succinoglycan biosynthesis protein ExoM